MSELDQSLVIVGLGVVGLLGWACYTLWLVGWCRRFRARASTELQELQDQVLRARASTELQELRDELQVLRARASTELQELRDELQVLRAPRASTELQELRDELQDGLGEHYGVHASIRHAGPASGCGPACPVTWDARYPRSELAGDTWEARAISAGLLSLAQAGLHGGSTHAEFGVSVHAAQEEEEEDRVRFVEFAVTVERWAKAGELRDELLHDELQEGDSWR